MFGGRLVFKEKKVNLDLSYKPIVTTVSVRIRGTQHWSYIVPNFGFFIYLLIGFCRLRRHAFKITCAATAHQSEIYPWRGMLKQKVSTHPKKLSMSIACWDCSDCRNGFQLFLNDALSQTQPFRSCNECPRYQPSITIGKSRGVSNTDCKWRFSCYFGNLITPQYTCHNSRIGYKILTTALLPAHIPNTHHITSLTFACSEHTRARFVVVVVVTVCSRSRNRDSALVSLPQPQPQPASTSTFTSTSKSVRSAPRLSPLTTPLNSLCLH